MKTLIQLASLTKLIIRQGRLPERRYDYQKMRSEKLVDLRAFCPVLPLTFIGKFKKWIHRRLSMGYIPAQAAFIKSAWRPSAGHLFVPKINLAYVRNPKAGSTSLCYAMLLSLHPELKKFDLSAEKINLLADVNLKREILPIDKAAIFFTVVRNPFARIVSVYHDFFERPSSTFIYEDYLFGILKKELSFSEFINILQTIPDRLKDQHLKPQHIFLNYYKQRGNEVFFFKLEEQHQIRTFLADFHLTMPVLNKNDSAYDYRLYYNKNTLEKVYQLYFQDITLFGYSAEYNSLRDYIDIKFAP